MLQAALETEIEEHLARFKHLLDEEGKVWWRAMAS
jgi:hypothetical protein